MEWAKRSAFSAALSFLLESDSGQNQESLASEIGVTQSYISALKLGKKEGAEDVRRKIAKSFGYEYEDFLEIGRQAMTLFEAKIREGVVFSDKADAVVIKGGFGKGGKQGMVEETEKDERIKDLKQQILDIKKERDTWRDLAQDLIRRGIRGPIIDKGEETPPFHNGGARNAM